MLRRFCLASAALACLGGARAGAQSASDLSAFSALSVAPAGALPPRPIDSDRSSLALRYGGWRYDIDDGDHINVGLTAVHRLGESRHALSLTGAYLALDCACSVWVSGGASLQSRWRSPDRGFRASTELAVGGARYSGDGHATALAATATLDLGVATTVASSRLMFSLRPGFGYGSLHSVDEVGAGTRALFGAAASWLLPRGVSIDAGMQRIILTGGPTVLGGGISWHAR